MSTNRPTAMRRCLVTAATAGLAVLLTGCGSSPPLVPSSNASGSREAATADMQMMAHRVTYELAKGVDVKAAKATGYRVEDAATKDDVAALAKALGVTGSVHTTSTDWTVGSGDRQLTVSRGAGQFFSMYAQPNQSVSSTPEDAPVAPDEKPVATTPPPSEPDAKKVAVDAFTAGGANFAQQTVETAANVDSVGVHFVPTFDGVKAEGFEGWVQVNGNKEITSASGYLGAPKDKGSYDLASVKRAVERLNQQQDELFNGGVTTDAPSDAAATDIAPTDPPVSDQPITVTLVTVKLGLQMIVDRQSIMWLTPSYQFDGQNGELVSADAVSDEMLQASVDEKDASPPTSVGSDDGGSSDPDVGLTGGPCTTNPADPAATADNTPIIAEVCVSAEKFKAGETVGFTISMADADRGFAEGPCFDGVSVDYGDKGDGEVRCLACAADLPEQDDGDAATSGGHVLRVREHTYDKPGTYTATFTLKSGTDCGTPDPHDSTATISVPVVVG